VSALLAGLAGRASLAAAGAALVAGALALAATRRPATALGVLLDLLLAAGLLRLTGDPSWHALATAAAIVLLRRLLGTGLRIGGRALSGLPAARRPRLPAGLGGLLRPAWRR
jgi:hypothetical protein